MPQYRQNVPSSDVAEDWLLASTPWCDGTGGGAFYLPISSIIYRNTRINVFCQLLQRLPSCTKVHFLEVSSSQLDNP